MKKLLITALIFTALPLGAFALRSDVELLDTPTAEVLPHNSFATNVRLFKDGGVLGYVNFGIINRLSIGASLTVEHLIGTNDEHVKLVVPAMQIKVRAFDGSEHLPALSFGFDNQGYYFDRDEDSYAQNGRGLYAVASKELFFQGLLISGGLNYNIDGFRFQHLAGFVGASYNLDDILAVILEYDNIRRINDNRLNAAIRFYLSDNFALDVAMRNFNNKAERVAQLKYQVAL